MTTFTQPQSFAFLDTLKDRLKSFLLDGVEDEITGLSGSGDPNAPGYEGIRFSFAKMESGTPPTYFKAKVIDWSEELPKSPYVRISLAGSDLEHDSSGADDDSILRMRFRLTFNAFPDAGRDTFGYAKGTESGLACYVYAMLRSRAGREALELLGFNDPRARFEGESDQDGFRFPLLLTFDLETEGE